MIAVAEMPIARNHRCHPVIPMSMRLNVVLAGTNNGIRIKRGLRWISKYDLGMDSRHTGTSNLIVIERNAFDFRRRHAHLSE